MKRVDQAVFLTAKAVKNGKFKGGTDAVFNLKNKGVGRRQDQTTRPEGLHHAR